MRTTASVAVAIWVAVLLPYITAQAERKARSLLYTFKERETMVVVAVGDTPSGPKVAVRLIQFATAVQKWQSSSGTSGPSVTRITRRGCEPTPFADFVQKWRSSGVSQAQFDRLWSTFMSSGADKYLIGPTSSQEFDVDFYYTFDVVDRCYAVPKRKASPALISVITQLRAYANKKQP